MSAIFWQKNLADICSSFDNLHNTKLKSSGLISLMEENSEQQNTKFSCRATIDFSYVNLRRKWESHLGIKQDCQKNQWNNS